MRLYEVEMIERIVDEHGTATEVEALIPTDETFPNTDTFLTHAKAKGAEYEGKTWRLISEIGEEEDHFIEPVVKYVSRTQSRKAVA